jgi:hypothetical protein
VSHNTIPIHPIVWKPCWRIVPSRFPSVDLFERVANPSDWEALIELEALTNDRIRDAVGDLTLVPVTDRVTGPGSTRIMAPFTHHNPTGSRFSDGTYGVFYAGREFETALAETKYHREQFLRNTSEESTQLEMDALTVELNGELHDIRGMRTTYRAVYDPNDYSAGMELGRELHRIHSYGLAYESVRHENGECTAVFRPLVLKNCRHAKYLLYEWDGQRISRVVERIS